MAIAQAELGLPYRTSKESKESSLSHTWRRIRDAYRMTGLHAYTPENIEKTKREAWQRGRLEGVIVSGILFNAED